MVHRLAEAELEVRHLNMTAPTGTVYFIQRTTVARRSEPTVAPLSPAVATTAEPIGARKARTLKKVDRTKGKHR